MFAHFVFFFHSSSLRSPLDRDHQPNLFSPPHPLLRWPLFFFFSSFSFLRFYSTLSLIKGRLHKLSNLYNQYYLHSNIQINQICFLPESPINDRHRFNASRVQLWIEHKCSFNDSFKEKISIFFENSIRKRIEYHSV